MQFGQRKWLMTALATGVVLFVAVGFVSLGGFIVLSKRRSVELTSLQIVWEDPISGIDVTQVSPASALLKLSGDDDVTAINTALRQNDLESAYSLVVLSTGLSDEERIGSLLLVGRRYAAANNVDKARLAYRQVSLIAILSPTLSDFSRADALLQAGEELSKVKQVSEAIVTLNQARTIGLYSVYLKAAHRKYILDRLIPTYSALGAGRQAWEGLEVALKPGGAGQAAPTEAAAPALGGLSQKAEVPPEVQTAQADREQKATALAEYVRDRGGKASETLLNELSAALTVEDALRQGTHTAGLLQANQLSDKIALVESRVHWLTIKYSIARRAQGVTLVPAWEQQLGAIQSDLAKARQDLYALYADEIVALPDASMIDRAWVELFRHELEMGRLGLYPNYPADQLTAKLHEATQRLMATGHDQSLRVDTIPAEESPMFILVDGADYGKGYLPR